jgi:hypothetical protein
LSRENEDLDRLRGGKDEAGRREKAKREEASHWGDRVVAGRAGFDQSSPIRAFEQFVFAFAHHFVEFRERMLGFLRRFTHPLGQLDPYCARKRLRPVHVRAFAPADFEHCVELYRSNEPERFPPGILPEFERSLQSGTNLHLVIEEEGVIVGCGGISISKSREADEVWLSFGLIRPDSHRRGLGSVLLLARLSMLPERLWRIVLQAVPSSRTFYEEFGFLFHSSVHHGDRWECSFLYAYLYPDDRRLCHSLLRRAGVTFSKEQLVVPVCHVPESQ